jgi:hypothetical protein
MPVDTGLDPEAITEIRSILNEFVDKKFAVQEAKNEEWRKDEHTTNERRIKELSARGSGLVTASGAPATRALVADDQKFRDFLGKGRTGMWEKFSASYPGFRLETKATITSPALKVPIAGVSAPPETSLRLVELLPFVNLPSGNSVEYVKETGFTPNAAIQVVEGDLKAVSDLTFAPATANVKTIATTIKASLQALADTPGLSQWLDNRLTYAVQLAAEAYLLTNATDGLMAAAGRWIRCSRRPRAPPHSTQSQARLDSCRPPATVWMAWS